MVIPILTTNVDSAAAWMNFVYDPVNAAKITAFVQYIPPCVGVRDELIKMGGDSAALANSPILFPDDATKQRLKIFADLTTADEIKIQNRFNKITGG
jgi:spermidine/putrescine transport system substrate-binding protein